MGFIFADTLNDGLVYKRHDVMMAQAHYMAVSAFLKQTISSPACGCRQA